MGADLEVGQVLDLGVAELGVPESKADGPADEKTDARNDVEDQNGLAGDAAWDLAENDAGTDDAVDGGDEKGDDRNDQESRVGKAGVLTSAASSVHAEQVVVSTH